MTNYSVLRVLVILSLLFGVSGLGKPIRPRMRRLSPKRFARLRSERLRLHHPP